MNYLTIGVGAFMFLYGVHILLTGAQLKASQVRLQFFKQRLGTVFGIVLFSIIYVILPVIAGMFVIQQGLDGVSMGQLLGPEARSS